MDDDTDVHSNAPAQAISLPPYDGRVIESANGIIDYDNVFGEGMDIQALEALHPNVFDDGIEVFMHDITLYRFMRQKRTQFTSWIRNSHISVINFPLQIKARLEDDRGGVPYPHINRHPAARNEQESWRRLSSDLIRPFTTPQAYSDFMVKFADASAVDIAMMALAIADPLEDIFFLTSKELPDDGYPEDAANCEYQLRAKLADGTEATDAEEQRIHILNSNATDFFQELLDILSTLLQNTALIRRQVRDALKICQRTDPRFETRTLAQQAVVIRQLIDRALDDDAPIHLNPFHNERLWSAVAYTPLKSYFEILATEMYRITVARNSIARLLRYATRTRGFEAQEDARRVEEREAFRRTDGRHLFADGLDPINFPDNE